MRTTIPLAAATALLAVIAVLLVVLIGRVGDNQTLEATTRSWDAYVACLERVATNDPAEAERRCTPHRP